MEPIYQILAALPYPNRDLAHYATLHFGEADLHAARMRVMLDHFRMVLTRGPPQAGPEVAAAIAEISIGAPHARAAIHLDKFATPPMHHDVKADEAVLRRVVAAYPELAPYVEYVHWAATSEDMSNIAWAQLHRDAVRGAVLPAAAALRDILWVFACREAGLSALAMTHGQPATPTTYGKRFAVFVAQIDEAMDRVTFADDDLSAKCSGPTGCDNAAVLVWPGYPEAAAEWIGNLGFRTERAAHQCSNYGSIITLLDALAALALALANAADNIHRYIEVGELRQVARGEFASASSVMPQKINPHALESAGAHMRGIVFTTTWMKLELGQNRMERELHTHPPERSYGGLYAALLVGIANITGTVRGIVVEPATVAARLAAHPEVLSEAFNTVARAVGIPGEYAAMAAAMRDARGPDEVRSVLRARATAFPQPYRGILEELVAGAPYIGSAAKQVAAVGPRHLEIAPPAPRRRPLVIMNLNQLLLDTRQFLRDHLATLTTRDPEYDYRPTSAEIDAVMRGRIPLHSAFHNWWPNDAGILAQYLHRCAAHPAAAIAGAPRALKRIAATHDIIICTGSGTSSARRRLIESGFPDVFMDIVSAITPDMIADREVTIVSCNPTRPTPLPTRDPLRIRRILVTGLFTRAECLEHCDDVDVLDGINELFHELRS